MQDWKQKFKNRGSVVIGPLIKGERHDISTTALEPDEWLRLRNVTPTPRGLRKTSAVSDANTVGLNVIPEGTHCFQRGDAVRAYVVRTDDGGYAMSEARTGMLPSKFVWSSMGSTTGRNIVVTFAAGTPSLSATIAGTVTLGGVTRSYNFDASFMLEPGDRLFDPTNPALTSLIQSVSATTVTFDPAEALVPAGATTLCILYKWQSASYPASLGYFIDDVSVGPILDTGRTPATQQPLIIPPPNTLVSSLARPIMISAAVGGQTRYSDREGFEGLLSMVDGGAAGFTHYPVDSDTIVKAISARSIEVFRGFLYMANTREVAYAAAAAASWCSIAFSPTLTRYVAIATGTNVMGWSTTGATWNQGTLPMSQNWTSVCWSSYLLMFVAVATGSATGATSEDGFTWSSFTLPSAGSWASVASQDVLQTIIVAGAGASNIISSHDLISWSAGSGASVSWNGIASSDTTNAVVVGNSATAALLRYYPIISSNSYPASTVFGIVFNTNTSLFYVTDSAATRSSPDGITWTITRSKSISGANMAFVPIQNRIVQVYYIGATALIESSSDGITWTDSNLSSITPIGLNPFGVDPAGNIIFTSATRVYRSTDGGLNWSDVAAIPEVTTSATSLTWSTGGGYFVLCGTATGQKFVWTSPTGATWTQRGRVSSTIGLSHLTYCAALALYIGTDAGWTGKYYTTTDLITFTLRSSAISYQFTNWFPELGVALNHDGTKYSHDGLTWSSLPGGTAFGGYSCINPTTNRIVGRPIGSEVHYYNPGVIAYDITLPSASNWRAVAYNAAAALFMAVASDTANAASAATAGVTWTARTLSVSADWRAIVATNAADTNAFIAIASGGTVGNVYKVSTTTWSAKTLSESANWRSIAWSTATTSALAIASGSMTGTKSTDTGGTWADMTLFDNLLWAQYGTRIRWSLSSDIRNFTNAVNYIDLPEQDSQIVAIWSDGQRLIAYLDSAIYYAVATGDPALPFSFLKLETAGIGLVAQQGFCRTPIGHIFVGRNGVYLMNNLQITSIGTPIVDVTIRKLVNPLLTECYYNETRNIVFFGFAVNSSLYKDQIWALNLDTKSWSLIERDIDHLYINGLYVTDAEGPYKFRFLHSLSDGTLKMQESETTVATGAYAELRMITGDMAFGDSDQVKEFFRIKFNIDENEFGAVRTTSLLYTISYSTNFGVVYKQIPGQLRIPVGQQEGYLNFRAIGNYIRFKIVSSSEVAPYTITSYTVDLKLMQPQQSLQLTGGRI